MWIWAVCANITRFRKRTSAKHIASMFSLSLAAVCFASALLMLWRNIWLEHLQILKTPCRFLEAHMRLDRMDFERNTCWRSRGPPYGYRTYGCELVSWTSYVESFLLIWRHRPGSPWWKLMIQMRIILKKTYIIIFLQYGFDHRCAYTIITQTYMWVVRSSNG